LFAESRIHQGGLVRRGDARLLVLEVLKEKPMHGYEVGKAISQLFGGVYEPSPGVVYPNLQWLEDEGMVNSDLRNGKKVYEMTDAGKRFAEGAKGELKRLMELGHAAAKGKKSQLMREGRLLSRIVAFALPELTDENAAKVAVILRDARERIEGLIE